jgi:hypothetical protein
MISRLVGKLVGLWMTVQSYRSARPRPADFRRELWPDSTRRMGVRLSEPIRDQFRRMWLRLSSRRA